MARKDLLASITASLGHAGDRPASETRSEYARRGASRAMMQSLDEMAESALRMMDGQTVVSLNPDLLDDSFVDDRIGEDSEEYSQLREAIRLSGQSSPILVRPHPDSNGRYMIVFGHRRAKVARELGIQVKAVVKPLADIEHVIAQGQENTARADLTFIEKALFARKLLASGMSKDTAKTALSIDDTLLSRMLSIVETVPDEVLIALGAAKGIGRDRWEELKKLVAVPANAAEAIQFVKTEEFRSSSESFNLLIGRLKKPKRTKKKQSAKPWVPSDRLVSVVAKSRPKGFSLEFADEEAKPFGEWISSNLDALYVEFRKSKQEN